MMNIIFLGHPIKKAFRSKMVSIYSSDDKRSEKIEWDFVHLKSVRQQNYI